MTIRNYDGPKTVEGKGSCDDDPSYFRLSMGSMGSMCRTMSAAGALDFQASPPEFPQDPGDEHIDWDGERGERALDEVGRAYERALVEALEGETSALVPAYKFSSNDGWLVTPRECRLLAEHLRAYVKATEGYLKTVLNFAENEGAERLRVYAENTGGTLETVLDFADYCERAAEHGEGFEVW